MCTRFYVLPNTEEIKEIVEEVQRSMLAGRFLKEGSPVLTSGEIRPTNVVPVLASNREGKAAAFPMRWGFRLPGNTLVVNARSESAGEKPTFRESWKSHRCVIPASWYYEWEHFKTPSGKNKTGEKYAIQPVGEDMTYLCGLYRMEEGLPVFTVLTREPTEELRKIHDRMPLMLPKAAVNDWIRPDADPDELLRFAVMDVVIEKAGTLPTANR